MASEGYVAVAGEAARQQNELSESLRQLSAAVVSLGRVAERMSVRLENIENRLMMPQLTFMDDNEACRQLQNAFSNWDPDVDQMYMSRQLRDTYRIWVLSNLSSDFIPTQVRWRLIMVEFEAFLDGCRGKA